MIVNITGPDVIGRVPDQPMPPCDHEEADTRICVHLKDAMEKGARKVFVRTVDTDVIVIITGSFLNFKECTLTWICGWHLEWGSITT